MQQLSKDTLKFLEVFTEAYRLQSFANVYVVGSYDFKKTVAVQQLRSAVLSIGVGAKLGSSQKRVAIVGGGFAGITAAATFMQLGHQVEIFEKQHQELSIQRDCIDRYIHPDLYDWPVSPGDANLAISGIKWRANKAYLVCCDVIKSFNQIQRQFGQIENYRRSIEIVDVETEDELQGKYRLVAQESRYYGGFDAVLIAVGFGSEWQPTFGSRVRGYWKNSANDRDRGTLKSPIHHLVSGNGDGGLNSVLGCALEEFDPSNLLVDFKYILDDETVDTLSKIELQLRDAAQKGPVNIIKAYDDVFEPRHRDWLNLVSPMKCNEVEVTFNSKQNGIFSLGSSLLNRFLVYVLIRSDVVHTKNHSLSSDMVKTVNLDGSFRFDVTWPKNETASYGRVIVRHGVGKENYFEQVFHRIASAQQNNAPNRIAALSMEKAIPTELKEYLAKF